MSTARLIPQSQKLIDDLQLLAAYFNSGGLKVEATSEAAIQRFLTYDSDTQLQIVEFSRIYLNFMFKMSKEGVEVNNNRVLLKMLRQELGLTFDESVFNEVKKRDIVEIYNTELTQIFRNSEFHSLCTYSLLDLISFKFYELYDRSPKITEQLMGIAKELVTRSYDLTPLSLLEIPKHLVHEKISKQKLYSNTQLKQIYPVYTAAKVFYGYLVIEESERANPPEGTRFI